MIRKYLRLSRAHTLPLETVPALMGAALAVGTVWSKQVALWAIFGALYHIAGYAHNSLKDWENGYDKDDPYKLHHPLNTGALSKRQASVFVYTALIGTAVYAVLLSGFDLSTLSVIGIAMMAGLAYNTIGKKTEFKFVYISIAHTMVFVIPFVALDGDLSSISFKLGLIYMFLWIVFQISVSGEVKDITQDEENFLKHLGAGAKVGSLDMPGYDPRFVVEFSRYVKHYAYSIKVLGAISGLVVMGVLNVGLPAITIYVVLSLTQLNISIQMLRDGPFMRHHRVRLMSIVEMLTAISFVLMYINIIGAVSILAITVGSVVWVVLGNKVLWGTLVGPEV